MTTQPDLPAPSHSRLAGTAADAVDLGTALMQLAAYATAQGGRHATLGAVLVRADQLPPALRDLASRVMRAIPTSGGWALADETSSAESGKSLEDRVVAVLRDAPDPLTDTQILQRLPEAGDIKAVRSALFADDRVVMADTGGWTLADEERSQELQLFELPTPEASPAPSRKRHRRSLKERAQLCLREASHPLSLQELAERMGDDVNESSLKYLLSTEDSFMRSDISECALTHWGLRRYTSVRELVAEELDDAGGTISFEDLERNLARTFTIKPSTLRQVASTAPYITTSGGIVRRLANGQSTAQDEADLTAPYGHSESEATAGPEMAGPSAEELIDLMGLS